MRSRTSTTALGHYPAIFTGIRKSEFRAKLVCSDRRSTEKCKASLGTMNGRTMNAAQDRRPEPDFLRWLRAAKRGNGGTKATVPFLCRPKRMYYFLMRRSIEFVKNRRIVSLVPVFLVLCFLLLFFCGAAIAQEKCPKIEVSGPAGITYPGETMIFTANVDVDEPDKLGYKWSVTAGTIENGISGPYIFVRTGPSNGKRIGATVEIIGLPAGCPNKGSEVGDAGHLSCDPPMLDEIERFSGRDFYRRLDSVAYDLAKFPESVLYFINYSSPSEKPSVLIRREKLIKGYLAKNHKIEQARMVFVNGGVRGPRRVKIYRIPSKKNWC